MGGLSLRCLPFQETKWVMEVGVKKIFIFRAIFSFLFLFRPPVQSSSGSPIRKKLTEIVTIGYSNCSKGKKTKKTLPYSNGSESGQMEKKGNKKKRKQSDLV
ncbi:hypothetical protein L873DRAFT_1128368 [Choiromyces venosus 120613-1]|uniref:Uncharacterized protein n=1 Tax=Choiromyces venosus 120613-1 TaxID=1336337 RepID=A0A3N4JGJ8_9PEZI|nr:hypothetical protein L873DRAFT_1128368 [Choiromyces venosus 120613-1]